MEIPNLIKQALPFVLFILVLNLMIFATPRLSNVDYQPKPIEHSEEFETHTSATTTDTLICTAHQTIVKCADINGNTLFDVDLSNYVDLFQVEVSPVLLLEANRTGVFIFFKATTTNGYEYNLGWLTSEGLIETWAIQEFQPPISNGFTHDTYRVNLKTIQYQPILTIHIINSGITIDGEDLSCTGVVYRQQGKQLEQLYNQPLGVSGCALTEYPTSFIYDGDLIIPFKTQNLSYLRYDPVTGQTSSFTEIVDQIKSKNTVSDYYQYLGYFVYHEKLHYVWGYNIRKITQDSDQDNLIQIFTADGLQAELKLQDFLPASILANKENQQYFLTFLQATTSQLYDSSNPSIDHHLATINIGKNIMGFVLNLRTIDYQGSFLFRFNPSNRIKLSADLNYQYNGGEEIFNLISIANIKDSILFEYQIYIDAPEFPFSYQLNWTGIGAASFGAKVEMVKPLLKYGLTNLVLVLATVIIIYLRRPELLISDKLYPKNMD